MKSRKRHRQPHAHVTIHFHRYRKSASLPSVAAVFPVEGEQRFAARRPASLSADRRCSRFQPLSLESPSCWSASCRSSNAPSPDPCSRMRSFFPHGMVRGLLLKRQLKYSADFRFAPNSAPPFAEADRRSCPSSSDRRSLMYSECAHTSGQAEPDAFPANSSRSGMSAAIPNLFGNQAARLRSNSPSRPATPRRHRRRPAASS